MEPGMILYKDAEFAAAKLAQLPVTVWWRDGEIADYGGPIELFDKTVVKINGIYYMRAACTFQTRGQEYTGR